MSTETTARFHSPNTFPPPMGYSQFVEVTRGKLVYIAGQVSYDATGVLVGKDDFRAQLLQIFTNLKIAVEAAGGRFADIVKLNYFCIDRVSPEVMPTVREVRDQFVNLQAPPASTFVVVSRLVRPDWLIEVEAVAVINPAGEERA